MNENKIPLIEFKNVSLGYGKHVVLSGINWSLFDNDFVGLVGPNGSGKTTLLRAILGNLKPLRGDVSYSQDEHTLNFGYVPQRERLESIFPFTALEVVLMGTYKKIGLFGGPKKEDTEFAKKCLDHVGILDLESHSFKNLSGGQKQRTLIARALVTRPRILVLDEPTNGMDILSQKSILDLIQELHDRDGLTVLMVSHLLTEVANYVKKIVLVQDNNFQAGSLEEILTNTNLSNIYKVPVFVEHFHGNHVIIVGEK